MQGGNNAENGHRRGFSYPGGIQPQERMRYLKSLQGDGHYRVDIQYSERLQAVGMRTNRFGFFYLGSSGGGQGGDTEIRVTHQSQQILRGQQREKQRQEDRKGKKINPGDIYGDKGHNKASAGVIPRGERLENVFNSNNLTFFGLCSSKFKS